MNTSSQLKKSKSPKPNVSGKGIGRPKNYLNKNMSKKYIYKKEKAIDTDKVLQNNKISKNIVLSPVNNKEKDLLKSKNVLNNSNCDLRRGLEIRDDVNIDYEKYQQQSFYLNNPTMSNYNSINSINNSLNRSFFLMNKNNGYLANTNKNNKWKCSHCGNVNSNFNYYCNNCNIPNTSLNQNNNNNSILGNQRNKSTGKNMESMTLDKNILNNSFNSNSINNSSHNLLSKSINNNSIMKRQLLKKNSTNANLTSNLGSNLTSTITNYNSTNNLLSPFINNVGYNTIRANKNNNNYFYSGAGNINVDNEIDHDNISQLYTYSNYLANELKTSNDTNLKLLENYQTNESEYNNNYQQNDVIKKKIKILKEKESQLDKINEQLQKSLSFIKQKNNNKNINETEGNNGIIQTLIGHQNIDEFKSQIKVFNEENEKLSDKLKENKDTIIKLKAKIDELSDDKKNTKSIEISKKNQKINNIKDIKEKINKCSEEIKEQNEKYNTLYNENKILEQKINALKKQIGEGENNNNNNNNTINNEEIKTKQILSIPISMNNTIEVEKDKYLKNKEKNNQLIQFFDELKNLKNKKTGRRKTKYNKLKEIYSNINKKSLIELMNNGDKKEKELIEIIDEYMNLLND